MSLTPKFCRQCGARLERRIVDEVPRMVCPTCDTVFYVNPLPAAAVLVFNERREVLCLKRKQKLHQGRWSFPIAVV
jgi:NADH pyrophosphatase NudC (nudix superfamily)